jgi:DNA-binding CsgD family transcriptional regulator
MENFSKLEQQFIHEKIKAFEVAEDWIPGIKIIQSLQPYQNLFICRRGLNHFGITPSFFRHLPDREFRGKIFDSKDPYTCLVGMKEINEPHILLKKIYIKHNNLTTKNEVDLVIEKELFPSQKGEPRIVIYQILPISLEDWAVPKTKKIVEEVYFQKVNKKKFSNLSDRNREVLSLWAQCLKAQEIGDKLFIGVNSVNSHKKRIKEILDTSNSAEIIKYGKAFDLI